MIEERPSGMPRAVFFKHKVHNLFASPNWSPINCPYFQDESDGIVEVFISMESIHSELDSMDQ